jgi:chitodextrinase
VLPDAELDAWAAGTTYTAGSRVAFDGSVWAASWWTRNQEPDGSPHGPWQEVTETFDGTAAWTPSRIFDDGDFVVHDNTLYEARWWTRGQEPGHPTGPWRPVG